MAAHSQAGYHDPDLLKIHFASYERFLKRLPQLLTQQFPNTIRINQDDSLALEIKKVHIIEPDCPEMECLEHGWPYQYRVLLDLQVNRESHLGVFLGRLPALTSRGTLLYGNPPVYERVAILQLRLPRMVQLARRLQQKRSQLKQQEVSNEIIQQQLEKLYSQSRLIHHSLQKKKKVKEIPTLQELLRRDASLSLSNYRVVTLGDLLEQAVRRTLQHLGRTFRRLPLENSADAFLFAVLPAIFTAGVEQYLNNSGLVQWLDKTNPLAEVSHKRKITFCGLHGIRNLEGDHEIPERQIHPSHYRCICPVETPESEKVGLNLHLAASASVDFKGAKLTAGDLSLGVSAALIPFIAHNDPNRALMGAKNMKQALPLLKPDIPLIQTGWESRVGCESRCCLIAEKDGEVLEYHEDKDGAARELTVRYKGKNQSITYCLTKVPGVFPGIGSFYRPPVSKVIRSPFTGQVEEIRDNQLILKVSFLNSTFTKEIMIPKEFFITVKPKQEVCAGQVIGFRKNFSKGDILLDGSATIEGMLALGVNLLVAYMPWYGYNFEDALVISDRLVKEDVLTSLHLVQDEDRHYTVEPRRVRLGDKLCNRHGHKGVIARIEPEENMPVVYGQDGQPLTDSQGRPLRVDLLINPHSVISRMNLGQLYETHWSWIAWNRKEPLVVRPFSRDFSWENFKAEIQKPGLATNNMLREGKANVRWQDPFTKEQKETRVVIGWQYWMKVNHLAEEKFHVRATGPRTLITKQPPKGKQNDGGQRVGEMEVWALQALRAQHILYEMLTVKSDAVASASAQSMPEALRALLYYLRGLGIDLRIYVSDGQRGEKPFPIEKVDKAFDPTSVVRVEACWATNDQVERWSKGEVITPDLQALWYSCKNCDHKDWSWKFAKKQRGPRRCPKCNKRKIDVSLRLHPQGLLSEAIFGEERSPERRVQMGHINLRKAVPHPLAPERQIRLIPVIPPDYRPWKEQREGLNHWYQRILLCDRMVRAVFKQNNKTKQQQQREFWKRELIRAVAGLYGVRVSFKGKLQFRKDHNSRHMNLRRLLKGKAGLIRGHILGKRVDFSGRAVIVPDPQLPFGCCRLPRKAVEEFYKALVGPLDTLQSNAQAGTLMNWCKDLPILLNRAPTLHRYNFLAFTLQPKNPFWDEACLAVHPLICGMYNADFDGDTMAFHLPLSEQACQEAYTRLHPRHHLFSVAHGGQLLHLAQDIVSGIYLLTTTNEGRSQLENMLGLTPLGTSLDKRTLQETVERFLRGKFHNPHELERALQQLDEMMRVAFQKATEHGLSFSIGDLQELCVDHNIRKQEASAICNQLEKNKEEWSHELRKTLGDQITKDILVRHPDNPVAILVGSGARGEAEQLARLCGAVIGIPRNFKNSPFSNYVEGLTKREYFEAAREARPDMVRKKVGPALGGDLTRKLVHAAYPLRIVTEKCEDTQGLSMPCTLFPSLRGRVSAQEISGIVKAGQTLDDEKLKQLSSATENLQIFSPLTCQAQDGICQRCYGLDPATGCWAELGAPVGLLAAQSIGERATQDFMKAFHGIRSEVLQHIEQAKAFFEWGKIPQLNLKDKEQAPTRILQWLFAVYASKVDPRHFEVILRQMKNGDKFIGVVQSVTDRWRESFLSTMAFQAVIKHVIKAVNSSLKDLCTFDPAPLFFGLGEPLREKPHPQKEGENVGIPTG